MKDVLKIAIAGVPNSGKSKLIEAVKNSLQDDYQVFVASNAMSDSVNSGLIPSYNTSNLQFQLECLDRYIDIYNWIEYYIKNYKTDKPVIILYESTPDIGKSYIRRKYKKGTLEWLNRYNENNSVYNLHKPDKCFILEMSKGEYSEFYNFNTQRAITIEQKIINTCISRYDDTEVLINDYSFDDKVRVICDYVNFRLKPLKMIEASKVTFCHEQECYNCNWKDSTDINNQYNYCPMCGRSLVRVKETPDPLGEESLRKMFYVDPTKLPAYSNSQWINNKGGNI